MSFDVGTISPDVVAQQLRITPRLAAQFLEEARRHIPDSPLRFALNQNPLRAMITLPTHDMLELVRYDGFIIVTAHDHANPGQTYFNYLLDEYVSDRSAAEAYMAANRDVDLLRRGQLKAALSEGMEPLYRRVQKQRRRKLCRDLLSGNWRR